VAPSPAVGIRAADQQGLLTGMPEYSYAAS